MFNLRNWYKYPLYKYDELRELLIIQGTINGSLNGYSNNNLFIFSTKEGLIIKGKLNGSSKTYTIVQKDEYTTNITDNGGMIIFTNLTFEQTGNQILINGRLRGDQVSNLTIDLGNSTQTLKGHLGMISPADLVFSIENECEFKITGDFRGRENTNLTVAETDGVIKVTGRFNGSDHTNLTVTGNQFTQTNLLRTLILLGHKSSDGSYDDIQNILDQSDGVYDGIHSIDY